MKKTHVAGMLIAFVLSVCFVSCRKDKGQAPTASPTVTQNNADAQRSATRSALPFEMESLEVDDGVDFNSMDLEEVAEIHNQGMEYVVDRIAQDGICPRDDEEFRDLLGNYLEDFLKTKGMTVQLTFNSVEGARTFDEINFCTTAFDLSADAAALSCDIENAFNDFSSGMNSDDEFSARISDVISRANDLGDADEKRVIQVTATICRSSSFFWKNNLSRITETLMSSCGVRRLTNAQKNVPWGGVAYADASGAITWGRVGFFAAGGPAGAVACGLAGGAGHSLLRLVCFGIFGS